MKEPMKKLSKKMGDRKPKKTKAQSMVEFALILPLLLIMFTGIVEFGFMLNTYLSLLDSTRFAARKFSNSNPMKIVSGTKVYDENFSTNVAQAVIDNLAPSGDPKARQLIVDPTRDDILISVIGVQVIDKTTNPYQTSITRYTTDPGPVDFYSLYKNGGDTKYDNATITNFMDENGSQPVNAGLLIVEVHYSYEGVLKLFWVKAFASEDNPLMLYSSTIMPLVSIRPGDPTATP